jgi:hypothetical protein
VGQRDAFREDTVVVAAAVAVAVVAELVELERTEHRGRYLLLLLMPKDRSLEVAVEGSGANSRDER